MTRATSRFAWLFVLACAHCDSGADCSCAPKGVSITSPASDLVGASGCGHAASCSQSPPCDFLTLAPPADGGACTVAVLFADGGTQLVDVDFGAIHHSTDCCGDFFDNSNVAIHVQ